MLGLVLKVLVYLIITVRCINAAELSGNREMVVVNTVQPLSDLKALTGYALKSAIIQKLKEVFDSQHPYDKFNLRAYDIENWPNGVESHGTQNWRKNDLVKINARIPFYRFVPRVKPAKAIYPGKLLLHNLEEIECLKSAELNFKCTLKEILGLISERFKFETGRPNASRIDWRLLDKSRIPLKYKDVPLNSVSIRKQLIFSNPEIVDNMHFIRNESEFDDEFENLTKLDSPKNTDDDKSVVNNEDEVKLDCNLPSFPDVLNDLELGTENENPSYDFDFDIDSRDLEELFNALNESSENERKSNENRFIDDNCGNDTVSAEKYLKRYSGIYRQRAIIGNILINIFKFQHADDISNMKHYEILNWPEGVSPFKKYWQIKDISRIRENTSKFVFVKRIDPESELGAYRLKSSNLELDESMTYEETHNILVIRYREESGEKDAFRINWKLLDRRAIPARYKDLKISSRTLILRVIYKNPEIINNIHFLKAAEIETFGRKRKCESDSCSNDSDV